MSRPRRHRILGLLLAGACGCSSGSGFGGFGAPHDLSVPTGASDSALPPGTDLAHDHGRDLAMQTGGCGTCPGLCCSGVCINPNADRSNCGGCGLACDVGEVCAGGRCRCNGASGCGPGFACCPGQGCVNLSSDPRNCAGCGTSCAADEQCLSGQCGCAAAGSHCQTLETCCPAGCSNLQVDRRNCGSCGNACSINAGCQNGFCVDNTPPPDLGTAGCSPPCPFGQSCLNGLCLGGGSDGGVTCECSMANPCTGIIPICMGGCCLQDVLTGRCTISPGCPP